MHHVFPFDRVRILIISREKIDVLANVAGVMDSFEAADTITDKAWDRVLAINLTAPTRMIRAVIPFMKHKKNGSIINVASKAAVSGAAAGIAYTAVSRDSNLAFAITFYVI